jgi:hypothetical protein
MMEIEEVGKFTHQEQVFLEVDEAVAVFGVYLLIFGKPPRGLRCGTTANFIGGWISA